MMTSRRIRAPWVVFSAARCMCPFHDNVDGTVDLFTFLTLLEQCRNAFVASLGSPTLSQRERLLTHECWRGTRLECPLIVGRLSLRFATKGYMTRRVTTTSLNLASSQTARPLLVGNAG